MKAKENTNKNQESGQKGVEELLLADCAGSKERCAHLRHENSHTGAKGELEQDYDARRFDSGAR